VSEKIDPLKVQNFERNDRELEAFWLFCVCVAGKNADQTATKVAQLAQTVPQGESIIKWLASHHDLHNMLVANRIGQYARIKLAVEQSAKLNLRTASLEELEGVFGVGPKTARFFLLNTRPGVEVAVLDTHVLRWIREKTYFPAPNSTPPKGSAYTYWEGIALSLIRSHYPGLSLAEADLLIWSSMSGRLEDDPAFA
jgi:thermostable 8-oxoguanine DNA glycosylase